MFPRVLSGPCGDRAIVRLTAAQDQRREGAGRTVAAHPGMRFSVDPWDPSYGVSLDAVDGQSQQKVDVDV